MYLSTIGTMTIAALCATSQAWEVTAYDNSGGFCNPQGNTRYRVITGASNTVGCMTFDRDMPGTGCREYTNGGTSNGGCTSGSLIPKSVYLRAGNCVVFDQAGCQGRYAQTPYPADACTSFSGYDDWGPISSFKCEG